MGMEPPIPPPPVQLDRPPLHPRACSLARGQWERSRRVQRRSRHKGLGRSLLELTAAWLVNRRTLRRESMTAREPCSAPGRTWVEGAGHEHERRGTRSLNIMRRAQSVRPRLLPCCSPGQPPLACAQIVANFTASPITGTAVFSVSFTNISPTSLVHDADWDFRSRRIIPGVPERTRADLGGCWAARTTERLALRGSEHDAGGQGL